MTVEVFRHAEVVAALLPTQQPVDPVSGLTRTQQLLADEVIPAF